MIDAAARYVGYLVFAYIVLAALVLLYEDGKRRWKRAARIRRLNRNAVVRLDRYAGRRTS